MKRPDEKENFVGMPIKMFAFEHENLFMNKKEDEAFILYYILDTMSRNIYHWGKIDTTVDFLSKKITFKNTEKQNKTEIKRLLLALHDKGHIRLFFDDESFLYDTLLDIRLHDLDSDHFMSAVHSMNFNHLGWVGVTEEMFKACNGNAKHFKMMIYTEWRMFRGKKNEGSYAISLMEWQKVMDLGKTTIVKLIKEVDGLNLLDKFIGDTYQDENGQPRRKTNRYVPVSQSERNEREEVVKVGDKDTLAKKQNTKVLSMVNQMDVTDERTKTTNLFNPDKKVWLNGWDIHVWNTTTCKVTKEQGNKRIDAIKKSNYKKYLDLMEKGKTVEKEEKAKIQAKENVEQLSQVNVAPNDKPYNYKKKEVRDYSDILDDAPKKVI